MSQRLKQRAKNRHVPLSSLSATAARSPTRATAGKWTKPLRQELGDSELLLPPGSARSRPPRGSSHGKLFCPSAAARRSMDSIAASYFSPYAEAQAEGRRSFEALSQQVLADAGSVLQAVGACVGPGLKLQTLVLCRELLGRLFRADRFVGAKQALLEDVRRSGADYAGYKDVPFIDGLSCQGILDFSKALLELYLTQYNVYDRPTRDYLLRIYALVVDAAHGLAPFAESLAEFLAFSLSNNVLAPFIYFYEEGVMGRIMGSGFHGTAIALFRSVLASWDLDSPASPSLTAFAGLPGGVSASMLLSPSEQVAGQLLAGRTAPRPEAQESLWTVAGRALEYLAQRAAQGQPGADPAALGPAPQDRLRALPPEFVADLSGHVLSKFRLLVEASDVLCRALEAATGCPFLRSGDVLYSVDASAVRDLLYPSESPVLLRRCVSVSRLLLALGAALCGGDAALRFLGEAGGPRTVGGKPASEVLLSPLADPGPFFSTPDKFASLSAALGLTPGQLLLGLVSYALTYSPWASQPGSSSLAPGAVRGTFPAPTDALRGSAFPDTSAMLGAARSTSVALLTFIAISFQFDSESRAAGQAAGRPGDGGSADSWAAGGSGESGESLLCDIIQHAALLLSDPLLLGVPAFVEEAAAAAKGVILAPEHVFPARVVRLVNGIRYVGKAQAFFEMRASFDVLLDATTRLTLVVLGGVAEADSPERRAEGGVLSKLGRPSGPGELAGLASNSAQAVSFLDLCAADFDPRGGDDRYHELLEQLFEFWYRFSVTISINMASTQKEYVQWVDAIMARFHAVFQAYYCAHLAEIRRAFSLAAYSCLRVNAGTLVRNSHLPILDGQGRNSSLLAPYSLKFRTHSRLLAGNNLLELGDFRIQTPGSRDVFTQAIPFLSADSFYSLVETNCPECLWEEVEHVQNRVPTLAEAAQALGLISSRMASDASGAVQAAVQPPAAGLQEADAIFAEFCALEAEFSMRVSYLVLLLKILRPPAAETQRDALFAAVSTALTCASELRYLDRALCSGRELNSPLDVYIVNRPSRHFAAACQIEVADFLCDMFSRSSMRQILDGAVGYMLGSALCRLGAADAEIGRGMIQAVESRFHVPPRKREQTPGELSLLEDTVEAVRVWAPHRFREILFGPAGAGGQPGAGLLPPASAVSLSPPASPSSHVPPGSPGAVSRTQAVSAFEQSLIPPLLLVELMLSLCRIYVTIGVQSPAVLAQLESFSSALGERQASLALSAGAPVDQTAGDSRQVFRAIMASPLLSFSFGVDQTQRGFSILSELCSARLALMLDSQSFAGVLRSGGVMARLLTTDFAAPLFAVVRCGLEAVQVNYRALRLFHTMLSSFALKAEAVGLARYQLLCRVIRACMGPAMREDGIQLVARLHDELLSQMPPVLQDSAFWLELEGATSLAQVVAKYWYNGLPDGSSPRALEAVGPAEEGRALLANPAGRLNAQTLFLLLRESGQQRAEFGSQGAQGTPGLRLPQIGQQSPSGSISGGAGNLSAAQARLDLSPQRGGPQGPTSSAPRAPLASLQEFVLGYCVSGLLGVFSAPQTRDAVVIWFLNCVAEPFDRLLRTVPPDSNVAGLLLDFAGVLVKYVRQRSSTLVDVAAPPKLLCSAGAFVRSYALEVFPSCALALRCHNLVDNIIDYQSSEVRKGVEFPGPRADSASPITAIQSFGGASRPGSTAMSPVGSSLNLSAPSVLSRDLERLNAGQDVAAELGAPAVQVLELQPGTPLAQAVAALDNSAASAVSYLLTRPEFSAETVGTRMCVRMAHLVMLSLSSQSLGPAERQELATAARKVISRYVEGMQIRSALPCVLEIAQNLDSENISPETHAMLLKAVASIPQGWTRAPDGNDFKFLSSVLYYVCSVFSSAPETLASLSPHEVRTVVSLLLCSLDNATVPDNTKFQACRALDAIYRLLCSSEQAQALRMSAAEIRDSALDWALDGNLLGRILESGKLYSFVSENSAERLGASRGIKEALLLRDLFPTEGPGLVPASPVRDALAPQAPRPAGPGGAQDAVISVEECLKLPLEALLSGWKGGRAALDCPDGSAAAVAAWLGSSVQDTQTPPVSPGVRFPVQPLGQGLIEKSLSGVPAKPPVFSPYEMVLSPYASFFARCPFQRSVVLLCDAVACRRVSASGLNVDVMLRCMQLADKAALLRELSALSYPGMGELLRAVESLPSLVETGPGAFKQSSSLFLALTRKLRVV